MEYAAYLIISKVDLTAIVFIKKYAGLLVLK